jgi:hypothetical protein
MRRLSRIHAWRMSVDSEVREESPGRRPGLSEDYWWQMFGAAARWQAAVTSWSPEFCPRSPGCATAAAEAIDNTKAVAKVIFFNIDILHCFPAPRPIWGAISQYEAPLSSPLCDALAIR